MNQRILIVQDDETLSPSLQAPPGAEPDCVNPVIAASGEEALQLLGHENFDALLVDLALSGMDGLEILVRAKQLHPGLTTFALGTDSTPELHAAALDSGAAEVLRRPLDRDTLLRALMNEDEKPGRLASLGGDFDIADLCLLGALSGQDSGIQAGRNGSTSRLVVADGALVHASSGELQGLAAFKQILSWKQLEFDWLAAATLRDLPPNVRLDTSWLLKIARWRQHPGAQAPETCRADGLLSGVHLQDLLSLLEKKLETGVVTVAAAGHVGALVLRDGRIVQADTDEEHGEAAVQKILSWKTLRVTYSRTAAGPAAHAGNTAMEDLEKLADELAGEITGALASAIVRLSDGRAIIERSSDPALTPSLASYAAVMRSHIAALQLLGGSSLHGGTEDLLITMEKTYLLIRMLGPDHFHALLLAKPANPALARYMVRNYEPFLLEVLERAGGLTS